MPWMGGTSGWPHSRSWLGDDHLLPGQDLASNRLVRALRLATADKSNEHEYPPSGFLNLPAPFKPHLRNRLKTK